MTYRNAQPIYYLKNGGRNVPRYEPDRQDRCSGTTNEGKKSLTQDQERTTMNTMNASYFIEKVGHGILNAFLLAALPTALVTTLVQAL